MKKVDRKITVRYNENAMTKKLKFESHLYDHLFPGKVEEIEKEVPGKEENVPTAFSSFSPISSGHIASSNLTTMTVGSGTIIGHNFYAASTKVCPQTLDISKYLE